MMRAANALVVAFLGWYVVVLVRRAEWLARATSIGTDVIVGFHALGGGAVLVAIALWRRPARRFTSVDLAAACFVELAFLALNLTGKVWCIEKEGPQSLAEAIARAAREFVR